MSGMYLRCNRVSPTNILIKSRTQQGIGVTIELRFFILQIECFYRITTDARSGPAPGLRDTELEMRPPAFHSMEFSF